MTRPGRWVVVVPIKGLGTAKSRMRGARPEIGELALAFATDTLAAAAAAERVAQLVVVTGDPRVAEVATSLGATIVEDRDEGLNAAVLAGLAASPGPRWAALTADLPGLRARELDAALALADEHPLALVTDHQATGTTLLTGRGVRPAPRFGVGSRASHEAAGHFVLAIGDDSSLRWDVDTEDDLTDVVRRFGVGSATATLLG